MLEHNNGCLISTTQMIHLFQLARPDLGEL